jgi:RNA polymerase sigma-70 factor (ECF subfamily)
MTERTLVQAAQAGLPEATDELIERYYPRVYSFVAMQRTGDAEDLTQEVFARALGALPRFNGEYQFGAWLIQIARNVCIDEARRQSHRPQPTDPVDLVDLEPTHAAPDDVWESVSSQIAVGTVHRALARLPKRQRTVLVLRELEGMSYADIAIALRVSTRAVEISLSRARKRMRLELKRLELAEGELAACRRTAALLASDPTAPAREEVAEHLRTCGVCQSLVGRRRRSSIHAAWGLVLTSSTGLAGILRRQVASGGRLLQTFANSPTTASFSPLSRLAEVGATVAVATVVSAGTFGSQAPAPVVPPAVTIVHAVPTANVPAAVPLTVAATSSSASSPASVTPAGPAPASAQLSQTIPCALTALGQMEPNEAAASSASAASGGGGLLGTGQLLSQLLSPINALVPVLNCNSTLAGVGKTVNGLTNGVQQTVNSLGGAKGSAASAQGQAGQNFLNELLGAPASSHGSGAGS